MHSQIRAGNDDPGNLHSWMEIKNNKRFLYAVDCVCFLGIPETFTSLGEVHPIKLLAVMQEKRLVLYQPRGDGIVMQMAWLWAPQFQSASSQG